MSRGMDPVQVFEQLRDTYLRYLETTFLFKDPNLRDQLRDLLRDSSQPPLVRPPILEAAPEFRLGRSVAELVVEGVLARGMLPLVPLLPPRLREHQEIGVRSAVQEGRNLVVATGTGSGKTEVFLLPILNHLVREVEQGTITGRGVRALLLYPMNALANDQLDRLRGLLRLLPDITFGRYTGETEAQEGRARSAYQRQHGREPLPNELISRERMQENPPHILLTNYAMLEYLLIRPKDIPLFSGGTWRFIVLDEVHTYSGAMGAEIAMLLRRLKDRVAGDRRRIQCFATSATLGRGREDHPRIMRFAEDLFGEGRFDVVEASLEGPSLAPPRGSGSASGYEELRQCLDSASGAVALLGVAQRHYSEAWLDEAVAGIDWHADGAQAQFLANLLSGDENVRRLQQKLCDRHCLSLDEVERVPGGLDLVALGAAARASDEVAPLLAARYHIMSRAMTGVFVWLDSNGGKHLLPRRERLYATPEGGSVAVFEMATCNRCGEEMLVGVEDGGFLSQPPDVGDQPAQTMSWFAFRSGPGQAAMNEDDLVEAEEDPAQARQGSSQEMVLCRTCGRLDSSGGLELDGCHGHTTSPVRVFRLENKRGRPEPRSCPACGNIFGSVAGRILTGKEAPVAVLATALYQLVPAARGVVAPGRGRKLIAFSDSRQDAAFFAPFMEQSYRALKQRRYLARALENPGPAIDLGEWARLAAKEAEDAGEWGEEVIPPVRARDAACWVLREWAAWDRKPRLSLEAAGVLAYSLRLPSAFEGLELLDAAPWALDLEGQKQLVCTLLDTLRLQGAVSLAGPSFGSVDLSEAGFAPRHNPSFVRGGESIPKRGIHAWSPAPGRTNKRLDLLTKLLARRSVPEEERERRGRDALNAIWLTVQHRNGPLAALFDAASLGREANLLRLHPGWWGVRALHDEPTWRCDTCGTVASFPFEAVCPMSRCSGALRAYSLERRTDNHYFNLYTTMNPVPLSVREHTAQLKKEVARDVQQDFIDGKVNLLSCTTTFELGVDLGDLNAVMLRNVPPAPGNYVQRAGRAGRRAGAPAIIVTYAQRRTHDLAYFEDWRRLVRGSIRPPVLRLANEKIVRRHMYAEALAAFFRSYPELFADRIESLFNPGEDVATLLERFLADRPGQLAEILARIVPEELHDTVGLAEWRWLDGPDDQETFTARLRAALNDVHGDWLLLDDARVRALDEARSGDDAGAIRRAGLYQRQLNTLRNRSLLGKLGTYGLMPKYGFPTEVVQLKVRSSAPEAMDIELERDMKLALTEFAPQNQVIAGGRIWTPVGIVLPAGERRLHEFLYWHCARCHYFAAVPSVAVEGDEPPSRSCHCGSPVAAWRYVLPEFGFTTGTGAGERVGDSRPGAHSYAGSYFHDDALAGDFEPASTLPAVRLRQNRTGWIHVINDNRGRGFYVCMSCGFAGEPAMIFGRDGVRPHTKPWSGSDDCTSTPRKMALGYRFRTDVLELVFPPLPAGVGLQPSERESLWLSLLHAIVRGACQELEIDERDLGGCLSYVDGGHPTLVLFDTCPGGAGFAFAVRDDLGSVARRAVQVLSCRSCGEDSSCIACLRNYGNQRDHNRLRRGLALSYLNEALPEARAADGVRSGPALFGG